MDKINAIQLLDETFNNDFSIERFVKFAKELFNHFSFNRKTFAITPEYYDYIAGCNYLGSYFDSTKKTIDVLVVVLKKTSSLDRARTMQRNFIAKYLANYNKDAALVAFYYDESDWRFSFVKLDFNLSKNEEGILKIEREITPVKRYSYLVGKHEPNHTCKQQFLELLMEENTDPSIEQIENAFSVDNVTKEFFNKYKELFNNLNDHLKDILKKNELIRKEFVDKSISSEDFAKKLLGQIVFIYFLQKKGWLGIEKDNNGCFKQWGEGPKNFITQLIRKKIDYDNFFNEILEPLFYDALANPREDDDGYYQYLRCKIPFLNGGLFEPINEYDWKGIDVKISNEMFEEIIKTFDQYNFTVKEDEPLDKEVAVDPEMLGKVFENLLNKPDRKSIGAYYTPREIVHFMCQQSLINYLETNSTINKDELIKFVQLGDSVLFQAIRVQEDIRKYGVTSFENSPISKEIESSYLDLDRLLTEIKIVDPAVGSGAFLVGMMNEIVKARSLLTIFFPQDDQKKRTNYQLKRETIENCLYGVDSESSAVEIAKLRFWLSLIVDEQDKNNIKPLPNLDHKIMLGNSLLESFDGKLLFNEKLLGIPKSKINDEIRAIDEKLSRLRIERGEIAVGKITNSKIIDVEKEIKKLLRQRAEKQRRSKDSKDTTLDAIFQRKISEAHKKFVELQKLQSKYFDADNRKTKKMLKEQIEKIEWEFIEETLNEQGKEKTKEKLNRYKNKKTKPFFIWKLYFSEVFRARRPGFDIVIANPPYIKEYVNRDAFDGLRDSPYYKGKMDIWYFFACKSIDLLKEAGTLTFIAQNNWVTSFGASIMRNKVISDTKMLKLLDFGDYKIFDSAGIQTMIMFFQKNQSTDDYILDYRRIIADEPQFKDVMDLLNLKNSSNVEYLVPTIKRKDLLNKPLTFSNNDCEILLNKIAIKQNFWFDEKELGAGIDVHQDYVTKKHIEKVPDLELGAGVFILSDTELKELKLTKTELSIIKPFYSTENLLKYIGNKKNREWIIYTNNDIVGKINGYPKIKNHLNKFRKIITSDFGPYGLHRARNQNFFIGEKIISLRKCREPIFTYTDFDCYVSLTFYVIKTKRVNQKYLTCLLNSKLIAFWLKHKGKMQGNNYQVDKEPLLLIPLRIPSIEKQKEVIELFDVIQRIAKQNDYCPPKNNQKIREITIQLDDLFYGIYDLSEIEKKVIENE